MEGVTNTATTCGRLWYYSCHILFVVTTLFVGQQYRLLVDRVIVDYVACMWVFTVLFSVHSVPEVHSQVLLYIYCTVLRTSDRQVSGAVGFSQVVFSKACVLPFISSADVINPQDSIWSHRDSEKTRHAEGEVTLLSTQHTRSSRQNNNNNNKNQ